MASLVVNYAIVLTDAALVASYQAAFPSGTTITPTAAAALYTPTFNTAFWTLGGVRPAAPRVDIFGTALSPSVASIAYGVNQTVDGYGNIVSCPGNPAGTLSWVGYFLREGVPGTAVNEALQTRRFVVGFESPNGGEGCTSTATIHMTRSASRTTKGRGLAYRSLYNEFIARTTSDAAVPVYPDSSWERIYIRPRRLPVGGSDEFWCAQGSVSGGSAVIALMTTAGNVEFYEKGSAAYPGTLLGTIPSWPLNTFARLDILMNFKKSGTQLGRLSVTSTTGGSFAAGGLTGTGGLGTIQLHTLSRIGNEGLDTQSWGLEADFDDWSNCSIPTLFTGVDWNNGNHIELVTPTGFNSISGGWSGDVRILAGNPVLAQPSSDFVTTSLALQSMVCDSDYDNAQVGLASLSVRAYMLAQGSGLPFTVGYTINGVQTTIAVTAGSAAWSTPTALYQSGGVTPVPITTPVQLVLISENAANLEKVQALFGHAEYIGVWGSEDDPTVTYPPQGIHNAPYWRAAWANSFTPPIAPFAVNSGTYTGNGTGQDINVGMPIHWFWCRPLSGNLGGSHWWSTMMAGHDHSTQQPTPNRFIIARTSLITDITTVSISGADAQSNANGVTYQWIAVSDAGMRYMMNGAFSHATAVTTIANAMVGASWTPNAGFFSVESNAVTADNLFYKGPGHATNAASPLTAAEVATFAALATGVITSKAAAHSILQTAFSLWRTADGTSVTPVAITNYTGDGTGPRNIAIALGGLRPLFAVVVPHGGVSFFKDPSHAATASQAINSSGTTTGAITGGTANQISVDLTLNANGVIYDVFVLGGTSGSGWNPNPAGPIYAPTVPSPVPDPWNPTDTGGWWGSVANFAGSASLITTPQNPKHPRQWAKINTFATGGAAMLGGSPGAGVVFHNQLIYAGDNYNVGTDPPTIRVFDGSSDRLMAQIPPTSAGVVAKAVISLLTVGDLIYFTTLDSGTSAADYAGRVFSLDPASQNIVPIGAGFSGGEVPYALVFHMNRLWLGTNKGNGTTGKIYFFRPGVDTAWTADYTLSTSSVGGCTSLCSFQGSLYIGTDNAAGSFAKVLKRDSLGVYSTDFTASSGTARVNNGFLSLREFQGSLFAGYWNNDTTAIALVHRYNPTLASWSTVYTGASGTLKPYIGMFEALSELFVVGGGLALQASIVGSTNGTTWVDKSGFLTGPATETALPIFGVVGA